VLLASFSSSVVSSLVAFLMTLLSFWISRRILTIRHDVKASPFHDHKQLGLLIRVLDGGVSPLWDYMKDTFAQVKRYSNTMEVVKVSIKSLTMAWVVV
jgi:hypothetical protein